MGCLFRTFFLLLLSGLVAAPAAAVLFGLEKAPLIARAGEITASDLQNARRLIQRYDLRRMTPNEITTITASAAELNTLIKGGLYGVPQVASRVDVNRFGLTAGVSAELPIPRNPLGRYVNIRAAIAPSEQGLEIARFAIGEIEVPPVLVRPVVKLALDHFVGPGKGEPIVASIRSVRVSGDRVAVAFHPPPALVEDLGTAARRQISVSNPQTVRVYYRRLMEIEGRQGRGRTSLTGFMKPLFQLARRRSETGDPVRENEAAILALAIFFGDARFERFVGEVRTPEMRRRTRSLDHVRLDGRHDFVQHFTISAGLALTGGEAAANIVGEIKEVNDSGQSSGFSFTDIGADRAGVRFARLAVSGEAAARRVQERLAGMSGEDDFFPHFADLPEGMSEAAFRSRYGDVDSPAYKRMIAEIDRRIERNGLYR